MNEELNRKLAEWVGFEFSSHMGAWNLRQTDGLLDLHEELPNFTESLDACFKWLVPKAFEVNYKEAYMVMLRWITNYSTVVGIKKLEIDPALALCLLIEKLIDGEK